MVGVIDQFQSVDLETVAKMVFAPHGFTDWRREDGVDGYSNHVLQHGRDDLGQHTAIDCDARIGVGLDQVRLHLAVQHEVQSEYLETVLLPLRV